MKIEKTNTITEDENQQNTFNANLNDISLSSRNDLKRQILEKSDNKKTLQ